MSERHTVPGDLGRRIAWRRRALCLSQEQLAEVAGLDPGYLGYLEKCPASPSLETVRRLADGLDTSVEELLGGTVDLPPGHGRAGAHPVLEKLDTEECLRLISPGGIGRVGFSNPGGPVILPVNYVFHEDAVLFRTAFGGPLDEDLRTHVKGTEIKIAFEVDRIDEANREGWSVLLLGGAHQVSAEERAAAVASGVEAWAGGEHELYIRVSPVEITGRRIRQRPATP